MLTESGLIYSWGKNDHNFLGREAKLDVKTLGMADKRKKLTFSTFIPDKITKLEKCKPFPVLSLIDQVKKIRIQDGKLYAFLTDDFVEEDESEGNKDSEIDSEEEKD